MKRRMSSLINKINIIYLIKIYQNSNKKNLIALIFERLIFHICKFESYFFTHRQNQYNFSHEKFS